MLTKIPLKIVPIENSGCHILIEASFNNQPLTLLIDTGASMTVFNKDAIEHLLSEEPIKNEGESFGIGAVSLESFGTTLSCFTLGDLQLKNYQAAMMDLSAINATYIMLGNSPIDGLLGGDILKKYKASIDYKTLCLKLRYRVKK